MGARIHHAFSGGGDPFVFPLVRALAGYLDGQPTAFGEDLLDGVGGVGEGLPVVLQEFDECLHLQGFRSADDADDRVALAAIRGLEALTKPCQVVLSSDSQYVVKGIQTWLRDWKRRGWKKADGKPVMNADLWQALDVELARHQVEARWVKGHAGHAENERVDRLANEAAQTLGAS